MMQFKVIAECENITKASERLYVTQPSLSHMLKKLEEELDCQLFDRVSNKIVLNKNGQKLLKYCNRMAKVLDDMYKDFSREEADENTIVIKSYASIQAMIIRYSTFDSETPIKISNIHDFDSVPDIFSQCDVVIASDAYSKYFKQSGLKSQFLFEDELLFCVPTEHELAKRSSITLDEIEKYDLACVRGHSGGSLDRWINDIGKRTNHQFKFAYEVTQTYWKSLCNAPYPFFARSMVCMYEDPVITPRVYIPIDSPYVKKNIYIWYYKKEEARLSRFLENMQKVTDYFAEARRLLP